MKTNTKVATEETYKDVVELIVNCEKEIKEIEEDEGALKEDENNFVFANIKELYSTFSKIDEHNYTTKIQNIDIQINIAVNLLSFSLALLIAFASISELKGNWLIPSLVVIFSACFLAKLIFDRKKLSKKLELTYLEIMRKYAERLLERTQNHLGLLTEQSKPMKKRILAIKEKLEVAKKKSSRVR